MLDDRRRRNCGKKDMENEDLDITFREMTANDIDQVYHIEETSFKIPWSKKSLSDAAEREDTIYLLAECNEKIVAYMGIWLAYGDAEITNVATLKEYRGKKIASRLFAEAIKRMKKAKTERMTLEVRPSNTAAIALYKKFGMVENGRRKGYYADNNEDALIFWNTDINEENYE